MKTQRVYNYDRGGNITSKVKYAYTTGTLGTAQQTIPYEYDTVWKDKLVKYDGKTITYDAIGNPLDDGERKYTWVLAVVTVKESNPARDAGREHEYHRWCGYK